MIVHTCPMISSPATMAASMAAKVSRPCGGTSSRTPCHTCFRWRGTITPTSSHATTTCHRGTSES